MMTAGLDTINVFKVKWSNFQFITETVCESLGSVMYAGPAPAALPQHSRQQTPANNTPSQRQWIMPAYSPVKLSEVVNPHSYRVWKEHMSN